MVCDCVTCLCVCIAIITRTNVLNQRCGDISVWSTLKVQALGLALGVGPHKYRKTNVCVYWHSVTPRCRPILHPVHLCVYCVCLYNEGVQRVGVCLSHVGMYVCLCVCGSAAAVMSLALRPRC